MIETAHFEKLQQMYRGRLADSHRDGRKALELDDGTTPPAESGEMPGDTTFIVTGDVTNTETQAKPAEAPPATGLGSLGPGVLPWAVALLSFGGLAWAVLGPQHDKTTDPTEPPAQVQPTDLDTRYKFWIGQPPAPEGGNQ